MVNRGDVWRGEAAAHGLQTYRIHVVAVLTPLPCLSDDLSRGPPTRTYLENGLLLPSKATVIGR